jgi:hypothetical protein
MRMVCWWLSVWQITRCRTTANDVREIVAGDTPRKREARMTSWCLKWSRMTFRCSSTLRGEAILGGVLGEKGHVRRTDASSYELMVARLARSVVEVIAELPGCQQPIRAARQ